MAVTLVLQQQREARLRSALQSARNATKDKGIRVALDPAVRREAHPQAGTGASPTRDQADDHERRPLGRVSNGPGGYDFFGEVGPTPKQLGFGEVGPPLGRIGFSSGIRSTRGRRRPIITIVGWGPYCGSVGRSRLRTCCPPATHERRSIGCRSATRGPPEAGLSPAHFFITNSQHVLILTLVASRPLRP